MFCLIPKLAEKVKQAIRSGKLNPERLNEMTSIERRGLLTEIVGEGAAKEVNLLFEKKLLLKNQEAAMYDWAGEITGITKEAKEATLAKIRQAFADKNRRLYEPKESENFLNELTSDIYGKKYKTEVSLEEAQIITELAQDSKMAQAKMKPDFTWKTKADGLDFGAKKVALDNYVSALKLEASQKKLISPLKEKGIEAKARIMLENAKVSANFIAENSRAIVASIDNSFFGRQGIKALLNPKYTKLWVNSFIKSWSDIGKTLKDANKAGDAIIDATKADIYSSKNYLNGRYEGRAGKGAKGTSLEIGMREEPFPTSFPSKIPVFGRFFRASEVAYEAGAMRLRKGIADKLYSMAEKNGVDMTSNFEIGSINELANSITGRGTFGKKAGEMEKVVNKAFFSIKFFKSNVDFLTLHQGKLSSFATKQAASNLLNVVVSTGIILKIAQELNPDQNKDIFTTISSKLGKITTGEGITIDITGGASGLVVLFEKIRKQASKSSTTGIVSKLGEGYGVQSGMDVLWGFTENKFSPFFSAIRDLIKQETFDRKKPTIVSTVGGLITPISIQNVSDLKGETGAMKLLGIIGDGLGFNIYATSVEADWGEDTGKTLQQFKEKVGDIKFKEANDKFNQQYGDWFKEVIRNEKYQALPDERKKTLLSNKKAEIKNKIFLQYHFKYNPEKKEPLPRL